MYTIVAESRVTLDTGLFRQNTIVLALKVPNDLLEAARHCEPGSISSQSTNIPGLVVDLVTESGCVDNCERDTGAFLVELWCLVSEPAWAAQSVEMTYQR
jgi:hypothetical protein